LQKKSEKKQQKFEKLQKIKTIIENSLTSLKEKLHQISLEIDAITHNKQNITFLASEKLATSKKFSIS
jgi:hypothetical protein